MGIFRFDPGGEAYYKPMLELVAKLQENDFTIYVVTATERNIVREIIKGTLDIPVGSVMEIYKKLGSDITDYHRQSII